MEEKFEPLSKPPFTLTETLLRLSRTAELLTDAYSSYLGNSGVLEQEPDSFFRQCLVKSNADHCRELEKNMEACVEAYDKLKHTLP